MKGKHANYAICDLKDKTKFNDGGHPIATEQYAMLFKCTRVVNAVKSLGSGKTNMATNMPGSRISLVGTDGTRTVFYVPSAAVQFLAFADNG